MTSNIAKAPYHCLVWIDHRQAHLYGVSEKDIAELALIHAPDTGHGHVHHHAGTVGSGHEPLSVEFLKAVAGALQDCTEILIAGPADAKHVLKTYIATKHPALDRKILGVETLPKTDEHELQVFASRFFHRSDRIHPAAP